MLRFLAGIAISLSGFIAFAGNPVNFFLMVFFAICPYGFAEAQIVDLTTLPHTLSCTPIQRSAAVSVPPKVMVSISETPLKISWYLPGHQETPLATIQDGLVRCQSGEMKANQEEMVRCKVTSQGRSPSHFKYGYLCGVFPGGPNGRMFTFLMASLDLYSSEAGLQAATSVTNGTPFIDSSFVMQTCKIVK